LKVCFINSNPFWGGAEKWHVRAAKYLASQGHEITFFTRTEEIAGPARGDGVKVFKLPFVNDFDLYSLFILFIRLLFISPDAVILNSERDLRVGGAAATLAGVKIRIHRKGISGLKRKPRYRWIYRHFRTHTMCVAEAVKKEIEETGWLDPAGLKTIHNGVNLDEFRQEGSRNLRAELGVDEDGVLVGALARLSSIKGLEYLIDAAPIIMEKAPGVKFALVGTGRLEEELKSRASRLGLGDSLVFTGFRSDPPDALRSFDIAVLPSVHSEGFSNSVIEAMACARPVVGTSVAGTPEAVVDGETGLIVPPRDSDALAQAVLKLVSNTELRSAMGRAGRLRVESNFDYIEKFKEFEKWLFEITGK